MTPKSSVKQNSATLKANPLETIKDFGSSTGKATIDAFKDLGSGMLDQLLGHFDSDEDDESSELFEQIKNDSKKPEKKASGKKEANIFNYSEYHETVLVKNEIKRLVEQIRREVDLLKKTDKSLLNEVSDIEKLAIDSLPEKPGIYHVRFLEIVLRMLQVMREKVGESRTWMQALVSKKKKRGSLFATRSKKSGTQYSMSQEISTARNVQ
jgi:hypothetical protein